MANIPRHLVSLSFMVVVLFVTTEGQVPPIITGFQQAAQAQAQATPLEVISISPGQTQGVGPLYNIQQYQGAPVYWGSWGLWGTCVGTCGIGNRRRQRRCFATVVSGQTVSFGAGGITQGAQGINQGGVQLQLGPQYRTGCSGYIIEAQSCQLAPCVSRYSAWTAYGACSVSCGGGFQFRTRVCTGSGQCVGPAEQRQACNAQPCRGVYGRWSAYSVCSVTCGGGTQTRTRVCAGINCIGESSQTIQCNLQACFGTWGRWSAYSVCTASCGGGTQRRTRLCVGSTNCGLGSPFQDIACNTQPCAQYAWGVWGSFGVCSASCGQGTYTRARVCLLGSQTSLSNVPCAALGGSATETQTCFGPRCVAYGQWGAWGGCTPACGPGTETRSRGCLADGRPALPRACAALGGPTTESRACTRGPCFGWATWGLWSQCTRSCGQGQTTRTRVCLASGTPSSTNEGCAAQGGTAAESRSCFIGPCYSFREWSQWSQCNPSCGTGERLRTRVCYADNQQALPRNCAAIDGGRSVERLECNGPPCYYYETWSQWTSCSATCGQGSIERSRVCRTRLSGRSRFRDCITSGLGAARERQPCSAGPCYRLTLWSEWTTCSATCGAGQSTRSRRCVADGNAPATIQDCGVASSQVYQTRNCQIQICYSFTQWTQWSSCSASCGSGSIRRTRRCVSADGTDAIRVTLCSDALNIGVQQIQPCRLGPCYSWTAWSAANECSVTCGSGTVARRRICSASDGSGNDPSACPDPSGLGGLEVLPCQRQPCYRLTSWTEFTSCSANCGPGVITRTRRCVTGAGTDATSFSFCTSDLSVAPVETRPCNLGSCYRMTQWTEYSPCSASCGAGSSSRTRRCVSDDGSGVNFNLCNPAPNMLAIESRPCSLGPCYRMTQWTEYSACSASCGPGSSSRTRRCVSGDGNDVNFNLCNPAPNMLPIESRPCSIGPCYRMSQWTEYSACSASCGTGSSSRRRRCVSDDGSSVNFNLCNPSLNMLPIESRQCSLGPCYRMTQWTEYSPCSVSCGAGSSSRTRRCVSDNGNDVNFNLCNPGPNMLPIESRPCSLGPCYRMTQWTEYSPCSASCGPGSSSRTRRCVSGDGTDVKFNFCNPTPDMLPIESRPCSVGPCYRMTVWSEYTTCSASCGAGARTRTRRCVADGGRDVKFDFCDSRLSMRSVESRPCSFGPCYRMTQWTEYSSCSASCGSGFSTRTRSCVSDDGGDVKFNLCNPAPNMLPLESRPCSLGPCYRITQWTEYSSCSASCGAGVSTRTRRCITDDRRGVNFNLCNPSPSMRPSETRPCSLGPCYRITQWTEYSTCSASCGAGVRTRARRCVSDNGGDVNFNLCNPSPSMLPIESTPCSLGPCYRMTQWTQYSSCSASCGAGFSTRTRRCVSDNGNAVNFNLCNPGPSMLPLESRPCSLGPCYRMTQWTEYTSCSASCGSGVSTRTRRCVSDDGKDGNFNLCNPTFDMLPIESRQCSLGPCYRMTQWSEYSSCSASCGAGASTRTRRCVSGDGNDVNFNLCNPTPDMLPIESRQCSLGPCYRMTQWTEYSSCSASCGAGVSTRTRRCVSDDGNDVNFNLCNPTPDMLPIESRQCSLGPCYRMTQWSEYSSCSASCGAGVSTRTRRCVSDGGNDVNFNLCNPTPDMLPTESRQCSLGPCYRMTQWTEYSSCSASCGAGVSTRTRRCVSDDGNDVNFNLCNPTPDMLPIESRPCSLGPCYRMTQWTEYSSCSASCGAGASTRTRRCVSDDGNDVNFNLCNPAPNMLPIESRQCSLGPCYRMTQWSEYSSCSASCGSGVITRTRRCVSDDSNDVNFNLCNPTPDMLPIESRQCSLGPCYFLAQWSTWTQCSASCGAGSTTRSRVCRAVGGSNTVQASFCSEFPGERFESRECSLGPCYRFSAWSSWSTCSSQCGEGRIQRTRTCETTEGSPVPNARCSEVSADFLLDARCLKPACPGSFRNWGQWSACSQSCGTGVRTRSRACSTDRCIGRTTERQFCNDFECAPAASDGSWSAWSRWSTCTNPCGGTTQQTRVCVGGRVPRDCGIEEYVRTRTCTDCPRGGGSFSIGSCNVNPNNRLDCGRPGITLSECLNEQTSCCWDDSVPGVPWCFRQRGYIVEGGVSGGSDNRGLTVESGSRGSIVIVTEGGQTDVTITETDEQGNTIVRRTAGQFDRA